MRAPASSHGDVLRHGFLVAALAASLTGCGPALSEGEQLEAGDTDFHGEEQEADFDLSKADGTAPVSSYFRGTCSTQAVRGLSIQIAEELSCLDPYLLDNFEADERIRFYSSAVLPYLSRHAIDGLQQAAEEVGRITITSGFRTVAQQYLLDTWHLKGRCDIPVAARPGNSRHEWGAALDVALTTKVKRALNKAGFLDQVPNDPVHFEWTGEATGKGLDVLAFQRLWNRNHPLDPIPEEGDWGEETEERLAKSPSGGFPLGAFCVEKQ